MKCLALTRKRVGCANAARSLGEPAAGVRQNCEVQPFWVRDLEDAFRGHRKFGLYEAWQWRILGKAPFVWQFLRLLLYIWVWCPMLDMPLFIWKFVCSSSSRAYSPYCFMTQANHVLTSAQWRRLSVWPIDFAYLRFFWACIYWINLL